MTIVVVVEWTKAPVKYWAEERTQSRRSIWMNCHSSCTPLTDVVRASVPFLEQERTTRQPSEVGGHDTLVSIVQQSKYSHHREISTKSLLTAWVSLCHKWGEVLCFFLWDNRVLPQSPLPLTARSRGHAEISAMLTSGWLPWESQRTEIARTSVQEWGSTKRGASF